MYPAFFHVGHRRKLLLLAICVVCFLLGLPMVTEVRTNCFIAALFSPFVFASADHKTSHTQGGMYIFQLFDYYACSGMTLLLFATLQCVVVTWIYGQLIDKRKNGGCFLVNAKFFTPDFHLLSGADRFYENIEDMIGYKPFPLIKYCLKFITPLVCMVSSACANISGFNNL